MPESVTAISSRPGEASDSLMVTVTVNDKHIVVAILVIAVDRVAVDRVAVDRVAVDNYTILVVVLVAVVLVAVALVAFVVFELLLDRITKSTFFQIYIMLKYILYYLLFIDFN